MRVLKGLGWFVAFALMLLVLAFAWGRLRGRSERQARALALFAQDMKPTKGRNAFPALWLNDYDVPSDQVDAVYQQDRPHEEKLMAEYLARPGVLIDPTAGLEAKYPKLPQMTADEKQIICRTREEDCLTKVRAHREEISALLVRQSTRLKHDIAFAETDYEWNDLPQTVFAIPPYGSSQNLWLTSVALDFVEGRTTQGLSGVCMNALTMRRLHGRNNTLVGTMIAAARLEGAASLFARMMSELPPDQALPESCDRAFVPLEVTDVDLSGSMQWEFRAATGIYQNHAPTKKDTTDWLGELTFSTMATERQQAEQFAWISSNEVNKKILSDSPFVVQDFPRQADIFDWVSNASGNVLILIPQPAYADYLNRQEDVAATLRLVATILWLRQTHANGETLTVRLQHRPAWMHMAEDRDLHLTQDGRSLHMGYHGPGKTGVTEWPLGNIQA
ncbi:hypothetical protein [Rhodanobacter sp. BL-MT-08]